MRKIILFILALTILLLPSCTSGEPSLDSPVTLNMWHVYGSQTTSPLNDAIDEFNKTVGRREGIIVNVVSVTSSSAIDKALSASAAGEPGTAELPDLFTAYPRVVQIVTEERLLCWDDYFSEDELSAFSSDFIAEGYCNGRLLMLPIAKSTEVFYLNKTLFDRFGAEHSDISSFEGIFDLAKRYTDETSASFFQINDYYHYFLLGMRAMGKELVTDGEINCSDEAFASLWLPLAECAIYGGICLEDGYAAARWKTAEIIANTGSSADVLYQPSEVFYADNTAEAIEAISLPYPSFGALPLYTTYRGGGLFAIRSSDEAKNEAACVFAKWLTEKENNLDFVTKTGYLPVTNEALEELFSGAYTVENASFAQLYDTISSMKETHVFLPIPLFEGASSLQHSFEENVKFVLKSARSKYFEAAANGEADSALLSRLAAKSLLDFKSLSGF